MMLKIRKYIPRIKKYAFIVFIVVTIINLAILFGFRGFEFRTIGYKIHSYAFRMFIHLIPLWIAYLIYKTMNPPYKVSSFSFLIRLLAIGPLAFLFLITLFFGCFGSYGDGSYDRCMEMCVAEDLSNYSECTFSTCDFPI